MGESASPVLLVILIAFTSLVTCVRTISKSQHAESFFNLDPEDAAEDLTFIAPDQFEPQEDNNDLKVKPFEEDGLSESDFYMSKEIYNIKDTTEETLEENYDTRKSAAKKDKRRLREQYQIDEAVFDSEDLENLDFRKRLEDVTKPNNDARNRTKKTQNKIVVDNAKQKIQPVNSKTDLYETYKSKPTTSGREKTMRNQLRGKSPEDFGLKQSSDPPFPDLVESANKLYDPKESDLNSTRLRAKLGAFYDESFMSIAAPPLDGGGFENKTKDGGGGQLHNFTRNKNGRLIPKEELPDYLKDINFKYIYLSDGNRIRTRISSKLKKKMQQFLQTYTKCRVSFKWKDLGPRFWPRYLRAGYCSAGGRASCSIPPGMICRPGRTEYKTLLRFHCGGGRGGGGGREGKCHWRNVQYPVVTACTCACA